MGCGSGIQFHECCCGPFPSGPMRGRRRLPSSPAFFLLSPGPNTCSRKPRFSQSNHYPLGLGESAFRRPLGIQCFHNMLRVRIDIQQSPYRGGGSMFYAARQYATRRRHDGRQDSTPHGLRGSQCSRHQRLGGEAADKARDYQYGEGRRRHGLRARRRRQDAY